MSPRACSSWEAAGSVFHLISECIIHILLKTHLSYDSVIAICAPTNHVSTNAEESMSFDNFYDLQDTLSSVPSRDMVIILGDFDAHISSKFVLHSSVIGPHDLGECNENGKKLLDFCMSNQLLITDTWFQHKPLNHVTWYCNGYHSKLDHMMNFVLVNSWFHSSVLDTQMFCSIYYVSDHEMVISTIRLNIRPNTIKVGFFSVRLPICLLTYRYSLGPL